MLQPSVLIISNKYPYFFCQFNKSYAFHKLVKMRPISTNPSKLKMLPCYSWEKIMFDKKKNPKLSWCLKLFIIRYLKYDCSYLQWVWEIHGHLSLGSHLILSFSTLSLRNHVYVLLVCNSKHTEMQCKPVSLYFFYIMRTYFKWTDLQSCKMLIQNLSAKHSLTTYFICFYNICSCTRVGATKA